MMKKRFLLIVVFGMSLCFGALASESVDLTGTWENEDGQWEVVQCGSRVEIRPATDTTVTPEIAADTEFAWRNNCWLEGRLAGDIADASARYTSHLSSAGVVSQTTMDLEYRLTVLNPDAFEVRTLRSSGTTAYQYQQGGVEGSSSTEADYESETFKARVVAPHGEVTEFEEKSPPQPVKIFKRLEK